MEVKDGVKLEGLKPPMRLVLRRAERIWKELGRDEGATVTSTTDGVHSAGSWHPYGYAVDLRTRYSDKGLGDDIDSHEATERLRAALPAYDIIDHSTHIHVEIGNELSVELGVFF